MGPVVWQFVSIGTTQMLDAVCVKANANGCNIVGQQHATLLGPTCWVHLHVQNNNNVGTNVGTYCVWFETGQTFGATSSNISIILNVCAHAL